jgi:hypothetical protein
LKYLKKDLINKLKKSEELAISRLEEKYTRQFHDLASQQKEFAYVGYNRLTCEGEARDYETAAGI